jgi:hypothetical protein
MRIKIKIDNVVEYYMKHSKDNWGDEDFPNVAPPFEEFEIEFRSPQYIYVANKMRENPIAGVVWTTEYKTQTVTKGQSIGDTLVKEDGWYVEATAKSNSMNLWFYFKYFCDSQGKLTKNNNVDGKETSIAIGFDPTVITGNREHAVDFLTTTLQPQLLAISFMHCKNTSIVEVDPNKDVKPRIRRHWEKKGKPPLEKYHVLNIEPVKKALSNPAVKNNETAISISLHICRGHFKDYRKGKGLFGKYKGLYWWDEHIKGDVEEGIVDKDYNIKI